MEHIELHVVLRPQDIDIALDLGLLDDQNAYLECEHCEEVVGHYEGLFYPFAVVLNGDDEEWLICYECYWPLINPKKPLAE